MLENSSSNASTLDTPDIPEQRIKRLGKLNAGDRKVRHAIPDIAKYLIDKSLDGDMRAAEIVHRYYIQPMREARDARRAAKAARSTSAIPASVSASLTRFSAILVKGESVTLPANPPAPALPMPASHAEPSAPVTIDASVAQPVELDARQGEAPANPPGGCARAWDPSPATPGSGDHTNDPAGDDKNVKRCVTCGHPIVGRSNHAKCCLACARVARQRSLERSAKKQAESRRNRKLQEEHNVWAK